MIADFLKKPLQYTLSPKLCALIINCPVDLSPEYMFPAEKLNAANDVLLWQDPHECVGKYGFPGLPRTVPGTPQTLSRIQARGTSIKAPQGNPYTRNRVPGGGHNVTFLGQ